jgi:hypothetical protein
MSYYITPDNKLYSLADDGSQDHYLPEGSVLATPEQVYAIQNPPIPDSIKKITAIVELEVQITPRRLREALLTGDNSFIKNIEDQIAALRES